MHTPGPWRPRYTKMSRTKTIITIEAHERTICHVYNHDEDTAANTAIITAGPDMLSALEHTLDALSGFENYKLWGGGDSELNIIREKAYKAMHAARTAIQKAKGE